MTQGQLESQVRRGAIKMRDRWLASGGCDAHSDEAAAAYMSGVNQGLHFLSANDGAVTPEELQRAVATVGKELGFDMGTP